MSQQSPQNQQLSQVASKFFVPAILSGIVGCGVVSADFAKSPNLTEKAAGGGLVALCAAIAGSIKKHEQFCLDKKLPIISWDRNNERWKTNITVENFAVAAERRENLLIQQRLLHGGAVVSLVVGATMAQPVLGAVVVLSVLGTVAGFREHSLKKELTKAAGNIPDVEIGQLEKIGSREIWRISCLNDTLHSYRR